MISFERYESEHNYIGNAQWQYKFTDTFYRSISGINYSAYWHDNLYAQLLHREKWIVNVFILKFSLDLMFFSMSFFRSFKNFQIHGMFISIILWIILVISSPYVIYNFYYKRK